MFVFGLLFHSGVAEQSFLGEERHHISSLALCLVEIALKLRRFRKPTFIGFKSGAGHDWHKLSQASAYQLGLSVWFTPQTERVSREQGWRSGESARLPPMCPEFDSQTGVICGLSLLVLYSAPRGFSPGNSGFPLSSKTNIWFWFDLIYLINILKRIWKLYSWIRAIEINVYYFYYIISTQKYSHWIRVLHYGCLCY